VEQRVFGTEAVTSSAWYEARYSRLEGSGWRRELAGIRECACQRARLKQCLANRIVHNRFWHENAWL
jgi:hypothetical protein